MADFRKGAQNAVKCLNITKKDNVIIVTDLEKKNIASKIRQEVEKIGAKVLWLVIEKEVGKRPVENFPKEFAKKIKNFKPTASYYIASGKKGELPVFRMPLIKLLTEKLKCRHGHMINIDVTLMKQGMAADYDKVHSLTQKVYKIVKKAKHIKVKAIGTDLEAEFNPKIKWIPTGGKITKQGEWSNLPEGEVFTCPKKLNGVIRAVLVGDFFSEKYGVLKEPLIVEVKNSRVSRVSCKNKNLEKEFKNYIKEYKNGDRAGEFAIGTLVGLKKFTGNLLQDEKFPGIHVAFGSSYSDRTKASWDSDSHVDLIPKKCTIWVGKKMIMRDGKFVI